MSLPDSTKLSAIVLSKAEACEPCAGAEAMAQAPIALVQAVVGQNKIKTTTH